MAARELVSIDGSIGPTAEGTVPVADDGLYRGDGVFEVIRLYGGHPYALAEHLDRLEHSAAAIELPIDRPSLERDIDALLGEFGSGDAQLRLVITRGGRQIAATETLAHKGDTVRLVSVAYAPSILLTGVKSLSYAANMQATRVAQGRGGDEALLVRPNGVVLEAPTSTIFWAADGGHVCTPALECGILDSITRRRVVEALEVEEGVFDLDVLLGAREAFLASTVREIQPVIGVDDRRLEPGTLTSQARTAFDAMVHRALP